MDLFCAALTTICEMVLPLILRYITDVGMRDLSALTVRSIAIIGTIYFALRIVDGMASYYMAYTGHVMGAAIETDMREENLAWWTNGFWAGMLWQMYRKIFPGR